MAVMGGAAFSGVLLITYGALLLMQQLKHAWFALLR